MFKFRTSLVLMLLVVGLVTGCGYAGVAISANGKKAVVVRNDYFLYGALRRVFVCDVTDEGLANCQKNESP
ncbi:MAG TPA: hypothetical protein PLN07_03850 [Myxococcota bacterium]|jgi:hypothetical protein|nr:hypothetical protein [Myxococcota bacterium]